MLSQRTIVLIFSGEETDYSPPKVNWTHGKRSAATSASPLEIASRAVKRCFVECDVKPFPTFAEAQDWLVSSEAQTHPPIAIIGDIWAELDNSSTDEQDDDDYDTSRARQFLNAAKTCWPQAFTYLVSTLPEDYPSDEAMQHGVNSFDAFISLAHYDANPWDELFNLIKTIESRARFESLVRDTDTITPRQWPPGTVVEQAVLFEKEMTSTLELDGVTFKQSVVIHDSRLDKIKLTNCVFEGDVLIRNSTVRSTSNISHCTFEGVLHVDRVDFGNDVFVQYSRFSNRPPWVYRTRFERRFTFRCNSAPVVLPELFSPTGRLPNVVRQGRDPNFVAQFGCLPTIMFYRCRFSGRFRFDAPHGHAKIAFYACIFAEGRYAEITFPFHIVARRHVDHPVVERRFRPTVVKTEKLFQVSKPSGRSLPRNVDIDAYDVDCRFTNSYIAGRLVIREHPWKTDHYVRDDGIGLNFSGATIAGAVNLRHVRVRWMNLDRAVVLGGELFMSRQGMVDSSGNFRWLALAADKSGIVFEERLRHCLETPRFTALLSAQLSESQENKARLQNHLLAISHQYEELRNAFARSPVTDWEEDYCHYKAMKYRSLAHWYRERRSIWRGILTLALMFVGVLLYSAWCGYQHWTTTEQFSLDPAARILLWSLPVIGILAFFFDRHVRTAIKAIFSWWIVRLVFAYGVYPARPVIAGIATIFAYAFVYSAANALGNAGIGVIQASDAAIAPVPYTDWRTLIYFSAVTFSTLGYGDYRPTMSMQWVAASEALFGAVMVAMVTISLARQFLRR